MGQDFFLDCHFVILARFILATLKITPIYKPFFGKHFLSQFAQRVVIIGAPVFKFKRNSTTFHQKLAHPLQSPKVAAIILGNQKRPKWFSL